MTPHFILYVADQEASMRFYRELLAVEPRLHVNGMTEFELGDGAILGLMPASGIKRLLGDPLPDPTHSTAAARAELYLVVETPELYHSRALKAGARELSPIALRNWGDRAGYSLDPDGYVIAFAGKV